MTKKDDASRVLGARRLTAGYVVIYYMCVLRGMSLRFCLLNLTKKPKNQEAVILAGVLETSSDASNKRTVTSSSARIFGSAPVEEHEEVVHGLF